MRLLFVIDGRSAIALNWMEYFLAGEHEVHLASTFACQVDPRLASFHVIPTAFSGLKKERVAGNKPAGRVWGGSALKTRTLLRQWLGPLTLPAAARQLRGVIQEIQPDLLHAMRIPYEGMLAAMAQPQAAIMAQPQAALSGPTVPLLVSVWGNDFTLHASSTPWMRRLTRRTLQRADALHTDCKRDARLAQEWGFDPDKPYTVLPGAGGVQVDIFYPPVEKPGDVDRGKTVINPRGFRAYMRNDVFFRAIPAVLRELPDVRFLCPNMAGEIQAERWVEELGIKANVELLPPQTRTQMAQQFRRAAVAVSPGTHDGTPNTLLESLACGCFPVAGDLESLREWISPGENGLLVDPNDPQALSAAILTALKQPELREKARAYNLQLATERAEYSKVMVQAEKLYLRLAGK